MGMRPEQRRTWVWGAVVLLAVLHQDFWLWGDRTLWGGFLPVGLGYHMIFSLVTAAFWALALKFAWPSELEAWANERIEDPTDPEEAP